MQIAAAIGRDKEIEPIVIGGAGAPAQVLKKRQAQFSLRPGEAGGIDSLHRARQFPGARAICGFIRERDARDARDGQPLRQAHLDILRRAPGKDCIRRTAQFRRQ